MGNKYLAALLKNKYFHQKILSKTIVITIALLLMTSFLHSAWAQVQPMRYNFRGNMVDIYFFEYDPENWCPSTEFYLFAADFVEKLAPGPDKFAPGKMGVLNIFEDNCQDWIQGYADLSDFTIEAKQGTLAKATLKGTATIEYYKEGLCCYPSPWGTICYWCTEYWDDDVTITVELVGSGEIQRDNVTVRISMPDLKWCLHQNGLFRPSSATITIIGAYTNIQKEIVYPFTPSDPYDPYLYDYAQIGRINGGDITLLRP